jgi:hypothetical protein
VARWQRLSETQVTELFDPPAQQRELIRHFTLTAADLAAILRCRGDSNRLGYGLMLCYLNYPGRALRAGERPPAALIDFVAEQIGVLPESFEEYLVAKRNCWRHSVECQQRLGLRPFGKKTAAELAEFLSPQAIENDRLAYLAPLAVEACRSSELWFPRPPPSNASAQNFVAWPDEKRIGA